MSEQLELKLEVLPGVVKAVGVKGAAGEAGVHRQQAGGAPAAVQSQTQGPVHALEAPRWSAERKQEVILHLAGHPGELYDLLQGGLGGSLAKQQVLPTDEEWKASNPDHDAQTLGRLLEKVRQSLAAEPLQAFALRGLTKEELLSGVFALWAEEQNDDDDDDEVKQPPAGSLAAELARLERKGPAVSTGEWLAEAAAEGSLHQPGPLFHEISARPFPASPVIAKPAERWGELLHTTPRAEEGLVLIMRRVAEAAARRAADLGK